MNELPASSRLSRFLSGSDDDEQEVKKKKSKSRDSAQRAVENEAEDPEPECEPEPERRQQLGFDNRSIRAAFVRKVFTLVTIMFAITAVFSALPFISPKFKKWCQQYWYMSWVALGVFIIFYITLMCCQCVRRCFPCNLIVLTLFTFSAAIMTMFICAEYTVESVLVALIITSVSCAAITVFAATTKKDLTSCLGIAFILGICLALFGIMCFIFVLLLHWYFLNIVYSALGALLCMFYLAIDIQMIMGGRRVEISPDEYIFAATNLFVDILSIFLHILGIVGQN